MTIEQKLDYIKTKYPRGMIISEHPVKYPKDIKWKLFGFLDSKLLAIANTREALINKVFNELKKPERTNKTKILRGIKTN